MNPTIEEMKSELLAAGWIEKRATVWQSPWCAYYRGPAGAYRIMKTERGLHSSDCDVNDFNLEGIKKPCNCQ